MVFEHDYTEYPELTNRQIEAYGFTSPHPQITEDFTAEVVKVHDGDTVTLRTGFRDFDFPLRLLGIDAPELNEGGHEARDWLRDRILNQEVQIKIDRHQRVGKYGRLLGKVFYGGLDVGEEMLQRHLAFKFGSQEKNLIPRTDLLFRLNQWF